MPDMPNTLDDELLRNLIVQTQDMIASLRLKGAIPFPESNEREKLYTSIKALIGDLQFYGIVPNNFHISKGTVVKHL